MCRAGGMRHLLSRHFKHRLRTAMAQGERIPGLVNNPATACAYPQQIADEFAAGGEPYGVFIDNNLRSNRILTPYPGTPLFRKMDAEGRLLHQNWDLYDTAHAVFRPKNMSPEDLEAGYDWIYERLYSHSSIWKRRPADWRAVMPYLAMSCRTCGAVLDRIQRVFFSLPDGRGSVMGAVHGSVAGAGVRFAKR
ncbi:MAG: DUF4070 domain-containing protein [Bryobacterales bacterium]|nr:DUF4070 domain-containing protein [Bryobacterales bacterium]